jgi:hypothetical protein
MIKLANNLVKLANRYFANNPYSEAMPADPRSFVGPYGIPGSYINSQFSMPNVDTNIPHPYELMSSEERARQGPPRNYDMRTFDMQRELAQNAMSLFDSAAAQQAQANNSEDLYPKNIHAQQRPQNNFAADNNYFAAQAMGARTPEQAEFMQPANVRQRMDMRDKINNPQNITMSNPLTRLMKSNNGMFRQPNRNVNAQNINKRPIQ